MVDRWVPARWNLRGAAALLGVALAGSIFVPMGGTRVLAAVPSLPRGSSDRGAADADPAASSPWAIQDTPNLGTFAGQLSGISCPTSSDCVAVGYFVSNDAYLTLAEVWNGKKWAVQPTLNPSTTRNFLDGVSCSAANACVAVGYYSDGLGDLPLSEVLSGTKWTVQVPATPSGATSGGFNGVSCTAANACVAVGWYFTTTVLTLAETWNGSIWAVQSTPDPGSGNSLNSVSCDAGNACIAVGFGGSASPLALQWNGSTWADMSTPPISGSTPEFSSVSCTASNACVAVGSSDFLVNGLDDYLTLAELWNGTTWLIAPTPSPTDSSHLNAVWCTGTDACVAVGYDDNPDSTTLAEAWNGSSWAIQPSGTAGSAFDALACTAATTCIAAGQNVVGLPFAAVWNGTTWATQTTPIPSLDTVLQAVSCTAASACVAVGSDTDFDSASLAEVWNGSKWAVQPTPNPTGAQGSYPEGVSCTAVSACMAVGLYWNGSAYEPLAEDWNGAVWAILPTPTPSGATGGSLLGVSCTAANACVAVGSYDTGSGSLALAEAWNGNAWTIEAVPSPSGTIASGLLGVSCITTGVCVAVGSSFATSGTTFTLAEVWNGVSWAMQITPNPKGAPTSILNAVSCTAPTVCVGVGYSYHGSTTQLTLAELWNGTTWTIETTPKSGGTDSHLTAVSCTAANACVSVGYSARTSGSQVTLVEVWDGITWGIQSAPNPKGAAGSAFEGLVCTASASCVAVGTSFNIAGVDLALTEAEGGD